MSALLNLESRHVLNLSKYACGERWYFEQQRGECNYLAIEFAAGGELMDYLLMEGKYALGERVARRLFRQTLEGLEHIHERRLTHRDIKPENLLFDAEFNIRIADFGFTTPIYDETGDWRLRENLGTQGYMAPEINQSPFYYGPAVDVFALGVTLFIMVMRRPPFSQATSSDPFYSQFCRDPQGFWEKHNKYRLDSEQPAPS